MGREQSVINPIVFHPEHLLVPLEVLIISGIPLHLHHQDHRSGKGHAHPKDIYQRRNACLSEYFHSLEY